MHLEIVMPAQASPKEGIRLASGYMRRERRGGDIVFCKPLDVRDGLVDLNGNPDSAAIRKLVASSLPDGTVFAIYDDASDPFDAVVDLVRSELSNVTFSVNKAYRIVAGSTGRSA